MIERGSIITLSARRYRPALGRILRHRSTARRIAMPHRFKFLRPIHVSASFHKQMILLAIAINKGSGRNTL
jgi:hypothetical protein